MGRMLIFIFNFIIRPKPHTDSREISIRTQLNSIVIFHSQSLPLQVTNVFIGRSEGDGLPSAC